MNKILLVNDQRPQSQKTKKVKKNKQSRNNEIQDIISDYELKQTITQLKKNILEAQKIADKFDQTLLKLKKNLS